MTEKLLTGMLSLNTNKQNIVGITLPHLLRSALKFQVKFCRSQMTQLQQGVCQTHG